MSSLAHRLWHTSPASLTSALSRRLRNRRRAEDPWIQIAAGPARGVHFQLPTPVNPGAQEMADGVFDQFIYEAIARIGPLAGMHCWDIGSFIGYHALGFANQGAHVIAFEPGTANQERFRQHLARNPELAKRIRLVPAAVSDSDGELTFVQSRDLSGASTGSHLADAAVPLRAEAYANFERVTVPAVRLDTFFERERVAPPRLMKIDVEGAELAVVQGARSLLTRHKPALFIEVHHILQMFGLQPLLRELGYELEILDREHAVPSRCFLLAR
jgi:FkbM family methyltransferase